MKFRLTVKPDKGEAFEVEAGPRDQLAWERGGPNRKFSDLLTGYGMTDLYPLAHAAAKRAGLYSKSLVEFEETVDVEIGHTLTKDEDSPEVDDSDEVPTQPAP